MSSRCWKTFSSIAVVLFLAACHAAAQPSAVNPGYEAFLKAVLPDGSDWFAHSVAMDGDIAVLGAVQEDSGIGGVLMNPTATSPAVTDNTATDSGSAYIFERDPSTGAWTNTAFLKTPLALGGDNYGCAVDISGSRVIVGARWEAGGDQGKAFIYERDPVSGVWALNGTLEAPVRGTFDEFGYSVGIDGDKAIVGAWEEDSGTGGVVSNPTSSSPALSNNAAADSGSAYIFEWDGSGWACTAYLKPPTPEAGALFGQSVAISGDNAVVGAPKTTAGGQSEAGSAFTFRKTGGAWVAAGTLEAPVKDAGDKFGFAVDILEGSVTEVIVGAPGEASGEAGVVMNPTSTTPALLDNSLTDPGAAFVYRYNSGTSSWAATAYLKSVAPRQQRTTNHISVALAQNRALVGQRSDFSSLGGLLANPLGNETTFTAFGALFSGCVQLFERDGTGSNWYNSAFLKAALPGNAGTSQGDYFGFDVAISGKRVLVGANLEDSATGGVQMQPSATTPAVQDNGESNSGAAYIVDLEMPLPTTGTTGDATTGVAVASTSSTGASSSTGSSSTGSSSSSTTSLGTTNGTTTGTNLLSTTGAGVPVASDGPGLQSSRSCLAAIVVALLFANYHD